MIIVCVFTEPIQRHLLRATLLLLVLTFSSASASGEETADSQRLSIVVFTPTTENNTYWPEVHSIMRAAASDLDINLQIHEFDVADRFMMIPSGLNLLTTHPLPDAAVFSVEFGQTLPLITAAEQSGVPFFINGPLFPEELSELGDKPGQEYQHWIGYFLEDEETKGYLLGQQLIAAARKADHQNTGITIQIAGINGARSWYGSILREAGLRRAIGEHSNVELLQMVYTRWTPEEGQRMANQLLARYPEISAIWAASDELALGAAKAIRNHPTNGDKHVFTGGLDLSGAGLNAVSEGKLLATIASTELIWAQVIVDLYDHLNGFAVQNDSLLLFSPIVADKDTAEKIKTAIADFKAIDFRMFSRFHHGSDARHLSSLAEPW